MGFYQQRFSNLSFFEKPVRISGLRRTDNSILHRLSRAYGALHISGSLQRKNTPKIQKEIIEAAAFPIIRLSRACLRSGRPAGNFTSAI